MTAPDGPSAPAVGSRWGVGANTCLERTSDGGRTWIPLYVASGAALYDLHFEDATTGWVCGYYELADGVRKPAIFQHQRRRLHLDATSVAQGGAGHERAASRSSMGCTAGR